MTQIIPAPYGFKKFACPMASNSSREKLFEGANCLTISLADAQIIQISGMREIIRGREVFKSLGYIDALK